MERTLKSQKHFRVLDSWTHNFKVPVVILKISWQQKAADKADN